MRAADESRGLGRAPLPILLVCAVASAVVACETPGAGTRPPGPSREDALAASREQRLVELVGSLRSEVESCRAQRAELERKLARTRERLAGVEAELGRVQPAEPCREPSVAELVPSDPDVTEDADPSGEQARYLAALEQRELADYEACIEGFDSFVRAFPDSLYADDAAYWSADCHFAKGDYRAAATLFADVVRDYPNGSKAPGALLQRANSLLALSPPATHEARAAYLALTHEFSGTREARVAAERLDAMGD